MRPLVALVLCGLTLGGCGGGGGGTGSGTRAASWTLMVYMDADNNLESAAIRQLNEMEVVGSDGNVNVIVQVDRHPSADLTEGCDATNGDWTTARRYRVIRDGNTVTDGTIRSELVMDLGEVDMADPATLRNFVTWTMEKYPAARYCLVVWNHGSGWVPGKGPPAGRAIASDDTSGTDMSIPELRQALDGLHLDIVALQACLMGMLEVTYEIAEHCDYVVASEASLYGECYRYDTILGDLVAEPGMGPADLARRIAERCVAACPDRPTDASAVASSKLGSLAAAVDSMAQLLLSDYSLQLAFVNARDGCQWFEWGPTACYKDLYDFSVKLADATASPELRAAAQEAAAATSAAVVYSGYSGADLAGSHGLSIYIPAGPWEYVEGYADLRFTAKYPRWHDLIRVYWDVPPPPPPSD